MSADDESEISARAVEYAKARHKIIVEEITQGFTSEDTPASGFMAGSPGAGKTEASLQLLANMDNVLRIDADELREYFTEYTGANSHLFQKATTRLVHAIHDAALKKKISFLMDGTFAGENIARQNIQRSLKRNRYVFILFVYQSPEAAWRFVQKREVAEGRRIRAEDFARKFCESRAVVERMKEEFGNKITVRLICKNIDGSEKFYRSNIDRLDDHIPDKYDENEILDAINKPR